MKKNLKFALAILLCLGLCACYKTENRRKAYIPKTYEFYIACDSQEDTVTGIFMDEFARILQEKGGGKIKVYTYPNSQLGSDMEITEAVQNGNITFAVGTTGPQVSFVKEAAIFDAPVAFKNIKVARNVLDGPLEDQLKKYYERKNIRLLAFADQGFRLMTSNKKILGLKDFKGIKIRTMENKNHIAFWKAIGANPTPMNWSEVYIGLEQGSIDAQENPLEAIVASKIYEKQKYIINTNHLLHTLALVGSSKILDSLPREILEEIEEAANEAKILARKAADERAEGRLKIVKDSGLEIVEVDEELYGQMKDHSKIIWDNLEKDLGKDLIDLLKEKIEEAEKNES